MHNSGSQRAVDRPAVVKAITKCAPRDPNPACPRRNRKRFATVRDQAIRPSIALLLDPRGPTAILGRVGSVIVDAIKGEFRPRPRPHVGIEVRKAILPPLTDRNAAATIIGKGLMVRVVAPTPHVVPDHPFVGSAAPMLVATIRRAKAGTRIRPTTATLDGGALQIASIGDMIATATTTTEPRRIAGSTTLPVDDREPSDLASGQIYQPRHRQILSGMEA